MKTNLSKEQQELLKRGTVVNTPNGETYYHLPYWYKQTKIENLFDEMFINEIPKELIRLIELKREGKSFDEMNPSERNDQFKNIISRFKNGEQKLRTSAIFNRVIQMLVRGCSEDEIIEHLCSMVDDIQKSFQQHLMENFQPLTIGNINQEK